jgi:1-acyl-sn-glycerol-3-phosphate acyltransferase
VRLRGLAPQLRGFFRTAAGVLYAGYAYALFTILVVTTFFPVVLLPKSSWRWTVFRACCRAMAFLQGLSIGVQGRENLRREGGLLLVANHPSYVDSYVLPAALPLAFRFVAKVELTRRALVRIFVSRLGTEYVERFDKQRGIADARRIGRGARGGAPLLFYPEGGTSRVPGLRGFQMGAFVVAAESKLRVVPVALRGTRSVLRSGSWFPRPGSVTVTIGPPVVPPVDAEGSVTDAWTAALRMRDEARRFILRHCGEPDLAPEQTSNW